MVSASRSIAKTPSRGLQDLSADSAAEFPRSSATSLVMRVAQILWPTKTDMALSHRTGSSDRMCRYWLQSKYRLSADDLMALLRSEEGFQMLEAIMGDAKPVWWKGFKRGVERAATRRDLALLKKRMDEIDQGELEI